MILAIAYSPRDVDATLRLILWIDWISHAVRPRDVVLVPSLVCANMSLSTYVAYAAALAFENVYQHVPERLHEVGWPGSPNFMFKETLLHISQHWPNRDILWLEPDSIPVRPDWYRLLSNEWTCARDNRRTFMGNKVPHAKTHMTGVGVYGSDWRARAPSLMQISDREAWDTACAHHILPHAHITRLIQHVWKPRTFSLKKLDPEAAIWHQDKHGNMMRLLDGRDYRGQFYIRYSQSVKTCRMTRYFHTENATRPWKAAKYQFKFEAYTIRGGVALGIIQTDNEEQQAGLQILASDPHNGIKEITQEEYHLCKKKRPRHDSFVAQSLRTYKGAPVTTPPSPQRVVASDRQSPTYPDADHPKQKVIDTVAEALRLGEVKPAVQVEATTEVGPRKRLTSVASALTEGR